jgi:hypothetical protein
MFTHDDHLSALVALADHLTAFDLPAALASTSVHQEITGHSVTVQLCCRVHPDLAAALLAWADTLTGVTAEAWRPPSGDSVHLSITGRLTDGSPVTVYGGLSRTVQVFGPYLEPGDRRALPLTVLREWADLGGVREVA